MTRDDELGMAWWNGLTEQERAKWSAIAGNTGRVRDAWEAFKRGSVDQSPPDQARRRFRRQRRKCRRPRRGRNCDFG